jgi:hypothetical protein
VRSSFGHKHGVHESRDRADRTIRWFGVPPPVVLLAVTIVSFSVSIALLAAGSWAGGLVLLGLAAVLASAFLEIARRRPSTTLLRLSADGADAFELMRARARAVAETQRERAERAVIESERRAVRLRLAEAIHSEDEAEAAALREKLAHLDRAEERLRAALTESLAQTDERIRRARLAVAQTVVVPPAEEDSRRPAA